MSIQAGLDLPKSRFQRISNILLASCLGVMAVAAFINVVLRYGFGSGVAASEELSRLLLVWMAFIGPQQTIRRASTWPLPVWWARLETGPARCWP